MFKRSSTLIVIAFLVVIAILAPAAQASRGGGKAECRQVHQSIKLFYLQPYTDKAPIYVWVQTTVNRCGRDLVVETTQIP